MSIPYAEISRKECTGEGYLRIMTWNVAGRSIYIFPFEKIAYAYILLNIHITLGLRGTLKKSPDVLRNLAQACIYLHILDSRFS